MITETVNAVLKAEEEARVITSQAAEEAKKIVEDADVYAEKLRKDTVKNVKEERKSVAEAAEKEGDEEYAKILLAGKQVTEKLAKEADVYSAADFIREKVLGSYVCR